MRARKKRYGKTHLDTMEPQQTYSKYTHTGFCSEIRYRSSEHDQAFLKPPTRRLKHWLIFHQSSVVCVLPVTRSLIVKQTSLENVS